MLTNDKKQELINKAVEARKNSYSPYSHFAVGAAVLAENGQIYTGANIENAAYPSSLCAERVAIHSAIAHGNRKIEAVAVVSAHAVSPCGACRQVMREFGADEMPLLIADGNGTLAEETTLAAMLPRSFGPNELTPD